jgi:RecQ family ATP-dependent DNA helicase
VVSNDPSHPQSSAIITEKEPAVEVSLSRLGGLAKSVFGHDGFRPAQIRALRIILEHRRSLVTLPTGSGKSLLYGVLAVNEPGITLVVSPLTALKREQAALFLRAGVKAVHLSFDQTREERDAVWRSLESGQVKLLFVSPERFASSSFIQRLLSLCDSSQSLARVFIDEAHCMASWGYDFRPEYRRIGYSVQQLGVDRVVALTATASPRTRTLIRTLLAPMDGIMVSRPIGEHISLAAVRIASESAREVWLGNLVRAAQPGTKTIVYVQRRRDAERFTMLFREDAARTVCYHAGLGGKTRAAIESYIQAHKGPLVIFATQAFGMGINLSSVDHVVVSGYPSGIEEMVQMLGRAGRGGESSRGTLLWSGADPIKRMYGIRRGLPFATGLDALLREWKSWLLQRSDGGAGQVRPLFRFHEAELAVFLGARQQLHSAVASAKPAATAKGIAQGIAARKTSPHGTGSEWTTDSFLNVLRMAEVVEDLAPGVPLFAVAATQAQLLNAALAELGSSDSQRRRVLGLFEIDLLGAKRTDAMAKGFFRCLPLHEVVAETRLGIAQLERVASALSEQRGISAAIVVPSVSFCGSGTPATAAQSKEFAAAPSALDVSDTVSRYREVREERIRGFDALDQFARAQGCRLQGVLAYFDDGQHAPCGNCDLCGAGGTGPRTASRLSTRSKLSPGTLERS